MHTGVAKVCVTGRVPGLQVPGKMNEFMLDYLALAFASSFGVLLYATARSGLDGLRLLRRRVSQVAGLGMATAAFVWFFVSEPRNIPDTAEGLDGNQQALLFAAGAVLALLVLLLLSSLRNWGLRHGEPSDGIEDLRHSNYLSLIGKDVRTGWKSSNKQTKGHSSG